MHFSTKIAPQKNWGWKWVLCQNGIYYKFSAVKLPKKGGSLHIFPIWLMAFQHNIMWQRVVQKCHFASFTISPNCPVLTCSGSDSDYDCVALDVRLVSFFFFWFAHSMRATRQYCVPFGKRSSLSSFLGYMRYYEMYSIPHPYHATSTCTYTLSYAVDCVYSVQCTEHMKRTRNLKIREKIRISLWLQNFIVGEMVFDRVYYIVKRWGGMRHWADFH